MKPIESSLVLRRRAARGIAAIAVICSAAALCGCGQKGRLISPTATPPPSPASNPVINPIQTGT